ncbi:helix-turn-helix domain-containing protein [Gulosibacter molinativorax]|uniref:XRE family transcriptional regulator n=1 Tax=Gulosibacter molinativorax TaxID=256821 RepID=A0ABT7C5Z0_9MICO|nr:XRE family transcriptional regulator [Gulosibacter molinativorax]MDJ1370607.1 XRE family transcriptional regulator [Gulosibacter molinativorax]QUY61979.1 HTH-type transcriptional regulator PuuR [Gulosibacter molinativorax]
MPHSTLDQLGPRLRAARQARELTLAELAERARVSVSTLSRLESGKRQATLELLLPITRVLDIRIDDLLAAHTADPRVRRTAVTRNGHTITPLSPAASPIDTYRVTYPPVDELPTLRVHDGYEWLYVLDGRLRLRLGDQDLVLQPGEAAEFDTRVPHAMSADGDEPARVISIFNSAGMRMHTHVAEAAVGGDQG